MFAGGTRLQHALYGRAAEALLATRGKTAAVVRGDLLRMLAADKPGTAGGAGAIVSLDVRTRGRRWHRSLVPSDSHDWDLTHASPLVATTIDLTSRRPVVSAGKDGILRTLEPCHAGGATRRR